MKSLKFQLLLGTACILILCLLASCSDTVEPIVEEETGSESMTMSLNFQPLTDLGLTVTRVHAQIQKGDFQQGMDLEIDGNTAEGIFEDLTPGLYEIQVHMYSGENLVATGSGEGVVVAGETTTVTIQMEIENGNLEVIVIWDLFIVKPDGTGSFATIQEAIDAAEEGDTIYLADGVFQGAGNRDLDFIGKNLVLRSQSGNPQFCVIDCQGTAETPHRGIHFHSGESSASQVIGIKFTNGYVNQEYPGNHGGSILCNNSSSPMLENCIFNKGYAADDGGGVSCQNSSSPTIINCVFSSNEAAADGSALSLSYDSHPTVINGEFNENHASWGAIYVGGGCSVDVTESTFTQNTAEDGGAVNAYYGSVSLEDCLFVDNSASQWGGAVRLYASTGTITECTFVGNSGDHGAGSILCTEAATATVSNTIIAFGGGGGAVVCHGGGNVTFSCSDIFDNNGGDWTECIAGQLGHNGNISEAPMFCDLSEGDYQIDVASPCSAEISGCGLIGAMGVGCENDSSTRVTIVDFTPFSPEVNWIEINDRDPEGLPLLRWQFNLVEVPANPILFFDYAGAEMDSTQLWVGEVRVTYLPATGGNTVFESMEIPIDRALLRTGHNQLGFISSFLHSQNEADGVLFRNVKLGEIDFTPFPPDVEWVECNDRDPVGLPFLRWRFTLSSIPENPSLVFEYAGAETDETQFWVGESHVTNLPSTGGGQEFSSYEIEIDPTLLIIGSNQLGFISGYLPSQDEADGVLFRNVRLIGEDR
jgi:hypothetical protein